MERIRQQLNFLELLIFSTPDSELNFRRVQKADLRKQYLRTIDKQKVAPGVPGCHRYEDGFAGRVRLPQYLDDPGASN